MAKQNMSWLEMFIRTAVFVEYSALGGLMEKDRWKWQPTELVIYVDTDRMARWLIEHHKREDR